MGSWASAEIPPEVKPLVEDLKTLEAKRDTLESRVGVIVMQRSRNSNEVKRTELLTEKTSVEKQLEELYGIILQKKKEIEEMTARISSRKGSLQGGRRRKSQKKRKTRKHNSKRR